MNRISLLKNYDDEISMRIFHDFILLFDWNKKISLLITHGTDIFDPDLSIDAQWSLPWSV